MGQLNGGEPDCHTDPGSNALGSLTAAGFDLVYEAPALIVGQSVSLVTTTWTKDAGDFEVVVYTDYNHIEDDLDGRLINAIAMNGMSHSFDTTQVQNLIITEAQVCDGEEWQENEFSGLLTTMHTNTPDELSLSLVTTRKRPMSVGSAGDYANFGDYHYSDYSLRIEGSRGDLDNPDDPEDSFDFDTFDIDMTRQFYQQFEPHSRVWLTKLKQSTGYLKHWHKQSIPINGEDSRSILVTYSGDEDRLFHSHAQRRVFSHHFSHPSLILADEFISSERNGYETWSGLMVPATLSSGVANAVGKETQVYYRRLYGLDDVDRNQLQESSKVHHYWRFPLALPAFADQNRKNNFYYAKTSRAPTVFDPSNWEYFDNIAEVSFDIQEQEKGGQNAYHQIAKFYYGRSTRWLWNPIADYPEPQIDIIKEDEVAGSYLGVHLEHPFGSDPWLDYRTADGGPWHRVDDCWGEGNGPEDPIDTWGVSLFRSHLFSVEEGYFLPMAAEFPAYLSYIDHFYQEGCE